MRSFSFFVPGAPRGKGRSRSVMGRPGHYPDPKSAQAEKSIGWICRQAMGAENPIAGPVLLKLVAVSRRPASWPRRRQNEKWKTSKPDLDNLIKLVKDGLNRVAWLDDAQVCRIEAEKRYLHDEGVYVTVEELELTDCPTELSVFA